MPSATGESDDTVPRTKRPSNTDGTRCQPSSTYWKSCCALADGSEMVTSPLMSAEVVTAYADCCTKPFDGGTLPGRSGAGTIAASPGVLTDENLSLP